MKEIKAFSIYVNGQWSDPCIVRLSKDGKIQSLDYEKNDSSTVLFPTLVNSHSHAFQYAMAGQGESRNPANSSDSFWTWRKAMYELALSIGPEFLEACARVLYSEMIRSGYHAVVEFHYLHHDTDGKPYSEPSLLSQCLIQAAQEVGINLTLVPVYYKTGGFGQAAEDHQRRFLFESSNAYLKFVSDLAKFESDNVQIGYGIHSLRACPVEEVGEIVEACPSSKPFHIHISEQVKEVEDFKKIYGTRPVEWMAQEGHLRSNTNLVHATHVNPQELKAIREAAATVVLCPNTEANLGDGIFPAMDFVADGGNWSIGSDSHINLNAFEELRLLEYGQRLQHLKRNLIAEIETGDALYAGALAGGGKSTCDKFDSQFVVGRQFNAMEVDLSKEATLSHKNLSTLLSTITFTGTPHFFTQVYTNGKPRLDKSGRHANYHTYLNSFIETRHNSI